MHGFEVGPVPAYTQPQTFSLNQLPGRATLLPFPDADSAMTRNPHQTPWVKMLNGTWKFSLYNQPEAAPDDFMQPGFDDVNWDDITVPRNWTTEGYDKPHYTNWRMPFNLEPGQVPDENPTGVYRLHFDLPRGWADRRVVVHFGGVESMFYLYCNGQPIGMSKDSRLPAEFDLTDFVHEGDNVLAAMVVRYSDGSWLEAQDHWWMAGVYRDVFLYSTEGCYIQDVHAKALLNEDLSNGMLDIEVLVGQADRTSSYSVEVQLFNAKDKPQFRDPLTAEIPVNDWNDHNIIGGKATFSQSMKRPKPWSAETPYLYTLLVTLKAPDGRIVETTATRVGFRRYEIRGVDFLVNGEPVLFKGVNRHDHDECTGKYVTRESMTADVKLMKQFNFNAVRTSHYPNDLVFLDLCDEYGLYVIDEANVETHQYPFLTTQLPQFAGAMLDRMMRMVLRDKNHPSIIMWSLGNESGYSPAHDAMAHWTRGYDDSRPIHYEGAIMLDWTVGQRATDVICPMYPTIDKIVDFVKSGKQDRPLILCEYSHAMGNSNGNLKEYWDAFRAHRGLQGGFIWDWVDQGLLKTAPNGKSFWAYGGDFGDEPNDKNFNINGLIWPDRVPHPAMWECHRLTQPIRVEAIDLGEGRLRVINDFDFITPKHLMGRWHLQVNGRTVQMGPLPQLDMAPGKSEEVKLKISKLKLDEEEEAHLLVTFELKQDQAWAGKGHLVAWEQFEWAPRPKSEKKKSKKKSNVTAKLPTGEPPVLEKGSDTCTLRLGAEAWEFNRRTGLLNAIRNGQKDLLVEGLKLQLFRGPTDNDGVKQRPGQDHKVLYRWRNWHLDELHVSLEDFDVKQRKDGTCVVTVKHQAATPGYENLASYRMSYTLGVDGVLVVEARIDIDKQADDLPRVGLTMAVGSELEQLKWFGRGPQENYTDRKYGCALGLYESTVADQYVPYILPQEHGHHCDTRFVSLTDAHNHGLLVKMLDKPFEFNASHFTPHDLYKATHTWQLEPRPEVWLSLDAKQRGLGGGSCGPDTLPGYRVVGGKHKLAFTLQVI